MKFIDWLWDMVNLELAIAESEKLGIIHLTRTYRSSRPEVFCKKGEACNSIFKKKTLAQIFSWELCEISKNNISYRTPLVAALARKIFRETNISYPLIRTRTQQVRSTSFFGKFCACTKWMIPCGLYRNNPAGQSAAYGLCVANFFFRLGSQYAQWSLIKIT